MKKRDTLTRHQMIGQVEYQFRYPEKIAKNRGSNVLATVDWGPRVKFPRLLK